MPDQIGITIHSFVGQYTIRNGSGVGNIIETGDTLYIGTGIHRAPPVSGNRVGVSIFAPDGSQRFPLGDEPAYFTFLGQKLKHKTTSDVGLTMTVVVSLYQEKRQDDSLYRAPYGLVLLGDPDQVGAWGADDNPN